MFLDEELVLSNNHNNADVSIGHILLSKMLLVSASLNGAMMYSRNKFAALENMCRERPRSPRRKWIIGFLKRRNGISFGRRLIHLRETSDPSRVKFPVQLDLCAALNVQGANEGKWGWSNVPEVPQEAKIWQSNNSS